MTDLIAKLDAHDAARNGAETTTTDLAFYLAIADEALRRLQAPAEEPLSEIIAELDQADLMPADVRDEVEAAWATWDK